MHVFDWVGEAAGSVFVNMRKSHLAAHQDTSAPGLLICVGFCHMQAPAPVAAPVAFPGVLGAAIGAVAAYPGAPGPAAMPMHMAGMPMPAAPAVAAYPAMGFMLPGQGPAGAPVQHAHPVAAYPHLDPGIGFLGPGGAAAQQAAMRMDLGFMNPAHDAAGMAVAPAGLAEVFAGDGVLPGMGFPPLGQVLQDGAYGMLPGMPGAGYGAGYGMPLGQGFPGGVPFGGALDGQGLAQGFERVVGSVDPAVFGL